MSDDGDDIRDIFKNPPPGPPAKIEPAHRVGRVRLGDISPRAWEHPADRAALTAMRKVPGFDLVLRRMAGIVSERSLRLFHLGTAVRVSDKQFHRLHRAWLETCEVLGAEKVPELYVSHGRVLNAGAIGIDDPFVVLQSGLLELLDDDEVRFVMAHELGHVLSGHALYRTMMIVILNFILPRLVMLPGAWVAIQGLVLALLEWSRKSELSCDRAGLLAVQDLDVAQRVQMKMAGGSHLDQMSVEAFREQAAEYENVGDLRDNVLKLLMLSRTTHPFPVLRLAELTRWVESGTYDRILDGDYPRRSDDDDAALREDIASTAEAYRQRWSERDDALGRLIQDLIRLVSGGAGALFDNVKDLLRNQGFEWGSKEEQPPEEGETVDVSADEADDAPADDDGPDDEPPTRGKTL